MKTEKLLRIVIGSIALIILAGCGVYTFNPRGQATISSIAIEPFKNNTPEFGLADRLTEIIIDAFIADGNIKVVPAAGASMLLIGTLTNYQRVVEQFDENDQVQQYKIVMDFEIILRDSQDDTDIWKQNMRQEGVYDALDETEEDGQRLGSARLVEAIIDKTTKSW